MKVIACYSSKGGVGKTCAAVNLAYASAAAGKRTLLIDLDYIWIIKIWMDGFRLEEAKQ